MHTFICSYLVSTESFVFTNPSLTKEFVDYTGVRQAELDMIKINRFVDKKILDSQTMYGDKTRDLNIL